MTLTEQKRKEFEEIAKKMIEFPNENAHPHCSVVVTTISAELVEGVASVYTEEYVKD